MKIKKMTLKKVNRDVFLLYSLLAIIVFQSGTVQAAINASSFFFTATRLIMVLIAIYFSIRSLKIIARKEMNLFLILTAVLEIIAVINFVKYPKPFFELQYKIWLFLMLYLVFCWARKKSANIDELMYNVLFFIAQFTLVMYVCVEIVQMPLPYTTPHTSVENVVAFPYREYFYVYYSYSLSFPPRMCGLFWEPGVNQIYLNLALLLYYILGKKSKYQMGVLIISLLFTQSTTGYIIMFVITALIISKRIHARKYTKIFLNMLFLVLGAMCSFAIFLSKKNETNIYGDSYAVRIADLLLGIKLFIENPISGIGFYNTSIFSKKSMYGDGDHGNSNGLLTMLYTTGLMGLVFLTFPFFYNIIASNNKREPIILLLFVLAINMTEPIYSLPIMMCVLAREYSSIVHY